MICYVRIVNMANCYAIHLYCMYIYGTSYITVYMLGYVLGKLYITWHILIYVLYKPESLVYRLVYINMKITGYLGDIWGIYRRFRAS